MSNCLNCVCQNCWIFSWLQVVTKFCFKRKHATNICIYKAISVIKYYNNFSSPVHTCFLDVSKVFDSANHRTLFMTLIRDGVPVILACYRCQKLYIQWGKLHPRSLLYRMLYGRADFISQVIFCLHG